MKIERSIPLLPVVNITYRFHETEYRIALANPHRLSSGTSQITLDGTPLQNPVIQLVNDGGRHDVEIVLLPKA